MKRLTPFILVILLLLTSCQFNDVQLSSVPTETYTTEECTTLPAYSCEETSVENITEIKTETSQSAPANMVSNLITVVSTTAAVLKTTTFPNSTVAHTNTTTRLQQATSPKTTRPKNNVNKTTVTATRPAENITEMRGIWISCYDHISAANKTRSEYKAETDRMFKTIAEHGFNTAFIHMRAFSDAFYQSDLYPYSSYIAGTEGASLPFDPFAVILESATKYGISVHGWINPFRVSTKSDASLLSASNPAKIILNKGNPDGQICVLKNGIYYNPACTSNHKLILDGVKEILSKYKIDGIHIDDYFYPSTDKTIDSKQYSAYKASGGSLGLAEWRRANVNSFVSSLYLTVKAINPKLTVSISPAAQIERNRNELYADCTLWLSSRGYADIIIPQIYFGFEHETCDFQSMLDKWAALPRNSQVKLACGLASYKCALRDGYAGTGADEWQKNTDILARQLKCIRKNKNYSGFVVFSYRDLNRVACKTEIQNFKEVVYGG